MVNTLRRIGTPLERLAHETGSFLADVDSPSELIPERPWWNLIELAARREGIPDLGLRIAASMPFDEIETIAATVRNCGTLGELLALFCRIAPLQSNTVRYDLRTMGVVVWCRETGCSTIDHPGFTQIRQFLVLGMIQIVQMALGKGGRPDRVLLAMLPDRSLQSSPLLGVDRVDFNAPVSAIAFPRHLLDHPVDWRALTDVRTDPVVLDRPPQDLMGSLRVSLEFLLGEERADIESIAALKGCSARTLQRQLTAVGHSFSELVAQTCYSKGMRLLRETDLPLAEVSARLGYSDYSKFSRAFMAWHGQTPRRFRRAST